MANPLRQPAFLAVLVSVVCTACAPPADDPPELYLWAWQRTEDLSFIDAGETKLAVWIATISLDADGLDVDARLNPVRYPDGTELAAVVRIEALPPYATETAGDTGTVLDRLTDQIETLARPFGAAELQLDFDATVSQRGFYRALLERLEARLPEHRLSITALASWCFGDPWIDALPIDSAVPMYYRMGLDGNQIRNYLSAGRQIPATICRDNAGYSLDEPDVPLVRSRRVFVFNGEPWDEETFNQTRAKLYAAFAR